MEKPYHIVSKKDTQGLGHFLAKHGQALLPMVELIEQSKLAVDELIDVLGRAQVEAVLRLSAERIAGPPHPGKKGGEIGWHGREEGTVCLRERKLRVQRPRLRKKGQGRNGEVALPAYEVMRSNARLGGRLLEGGETSLILRRSAPAKAMRSWAGSSARRTAWSRSSR